VVRELDLDVSPHCEPIDLDLELWALRPGSRQQSTVSTCGAQPGMRRPSRTGLAVLVAIVSVCATLAGEYVIRDIGWPDLGAVAASVDRAFSSPVPVSSERAAPEVPQRLPLLPSTALIAPVQSSLPSAHPALDSAPAADDESLLEGQGALPSHRLTEAVASSIASNDLSAVAQRRMSGPSAPRATAGTQVKANSTSSVAAARPVLGQPAGYREGDVTPVARSQEQRVEIEDVLRRYQLAYRNLDAGGAKAIWPALDERALSRAFAALSSQEVRFDRCVIHLSSPDAEAVCAGVAAYVPKDGSRDPRSDRRRWIFQLRKTEGAWTIVRADAGQDDGP
jgi:hypothetical protein